MIVIKTVSPPTEGIHHCESNTSAFVDDKDLGKGTLYISESVLCWLSNDGVGFSLSYPDISIHGVSKDGSISPEPCLFLITDAKISIEENGTNCSSIEDQMNDMSVAEDEAEEQEDNGEEDGENSQIYFVPENKEMLDIMFQSLSDCQTMNPDPEDIDDDDDEIYMAPTFDIQVADCPLEEYGNGDDGEDEYEEMNEEDQFEDAE